MCCLRFSSPIRTGSCEFLTSETCQTDLIERVGWRQSWRPHSFSLFAWFIFRFPFFIFCRTTVHYTNLDNTNFQFPKFERVISRLDYLSMTDTAVKKLYETCVQYIIHIARATSLTMASHAIDDSSQCLLCFQTISFQGFGPTRKIDTKVIAGRTE